MCGILGYISKKKPLQEDDFRDAINLMSHRGPDATGIFQYHHVFLGHKRLSIIDLSESANQPMFSADDRFVIIFNGEIYNYQELTKKFNLSQKTSSDTEVILQLFIQKGAEIPSLFNGMFSLAIFDKQTQELYLARDRMGIKPLYYFFDGETFAFSSELKSLVKLKPIAGQLKLNYEAIKSYLHLGYIPQPHSVYQNIYKFPSGNFAVLKEGKLTFKEYWNPESQIGKDIISDEKEALQNLDSLLTESVRYRMICDVPFGTLLSGGIDSSLVTAISAKINPQKLNTYTIGFSENAFNEAPHASSVAKHLNTTHHEYFVTEKEALNLVPSILQSYDEPFADSSAIPTMLVSKMAAQDVKMVLSGDGGDELFHGYGAYMWANRLNNPMVKHTRKVLASGLNLGNSRHKRISKVLDYKTEKNIESHIFSQEQYFFSESEIEKISTDDFNKASGFNYVAPEVLRLLTPAENQSLFDLKYYLKDDLLVKVDRASMKYSLEVRVPMLDYRIIAFALNLHPSLKINNGTQKYLLKKLLYKYCPQELFARPKKGFAIPLEKWLKNELSFLISENLSPSAIAKTGLFKWSEIQKLLKRYQGGDDYLYNRIWNLIILQQFLLSHDF